MGGLQTVIRYGSTNVIERALNQPFKLCSFIRLCKKVNDAESQQHMNADVPTCKLHHLVAAACKETGSCSAGTTILLL